MCLFRGSNFENGVVNKEVSRMISVMFYRHRKPKVLKSKKQDRDSHGDSHWTVTEGGKHCCVLDGGALCAILNQAKYVLYFSGSERGLVRIHCGTTPIIVTVNCGRNAITNFLGCFSVGTSLESSILYFPYLRHVRAAFATHGLP
jgi:hypothetical protein